MCLSGDGEATKHLKGLVIYGVCGSKYTVQSKDLLNCEMDPFRTLFPFELLD